MDFGEMISLTTTAGRDVAGDLWHWFLTNFNTAFIMTTVTAVSRMLSRREHKKTADDLAATRAALAAAIAEKAAVASAQSSKENAHISQAIAENTAISTQAADGAERAYHEANSVNAKIANLGAAQNALKTKQDDMQHERDDDQRR